MDNDIMLLAQVDRTFNTEVWLTPLILLPGVALMIVSTSARFGQLHSEFHKIIERPNAHVRILSRNMVRRSKLFRDALASLYVSVGLFALGSLIGAFVDFFWPTSVWFVGAFTIAGIMCVVFAAAQLFRESLVCLDVITEQSESVAKHDDAAGSGREAQAMSRNA